MNPCEICLIKPEFKVNIHEIYLNEYNLKDIIYELTQTKLSQDEHLPFWICGACADKLVDFHAFRQKLLEYHKKLVKLQYLDDGTDIARSSDATDFDNEDNKIFIESLAESFETDHAEDLEITFEAESDNDDSDSSLSEPLSDGFKEKDTKTVTALLGIDDPLDATSIIKDNGKRSAHKVSSKVKQQEENDHRLSSVLVKSNDEINLCPLCNKQISTRSNLKRHLTEFHSKPRNSDSMVSEKIASTVKRKCPLCFSLYVTGSSLKKHLKNMHLIIFDAPDADRSKRFTCETCNVPHATLKFLQKHCHDEHTEWNKSKSKQRYIDDLICAGCSFKFKTADSFRSHSKQAHHLLDDDIDLLLRPWRQSNDGVKLKIEKNLAENSRDKETNLNLNEQDAQLLSEDAEVDTSNDEHTDEIDCTKCHRRFENRMQWFDHYLFYHMKVDEVAYKPCPLCANMIHLAGPGSWKRLRHHIRNRHPKIDDRMREIRLKTGKISCPECDEQYEDILIMYDHFKTHDINHGDNADGYNLNCEPCNLKLSNLDEYAKHKRREHNISEDQLILPLKCVWCNQRFEKFTNLHNHLRFGHDRIRRKKMETSSLLCMICGKIAPDIRKLNSHLLTHTETKLIKCKVCSSTFKHKYDLYKHVTIVHSDVRKYHCKICDRKFKIKGHLNRHMISHGVGVKHHECKICGKQFNQPDNLRVHMWTHRDDYPFNCSLCKKGFIRKKKLTEHIESEH